MDNFVHKVASGEIGVWVDDGTICVKITNQHNDPVELAEHEAEDLANLLLRLVKEIRAD